MRRNHPKRTHSKRIHSKRTAGPTPEYSMEELRKTFESGLEFVETMIQDWEDGEADYVLADAENLADYYIENLIIDQRELVKALKRLRRGSSSRRAGNR